MGAANFADVRPGVIANLRSYGKRPALEPLAFAGIHVISPRFLKMMSENGVFSVIDCYLRLAGQDEKISAFRADQYSWRDLGKPESIRAAELDLFQPGASFVDFFSPSLLSPTPGPA